MVLIIIIIFNKYNLCFDLSKLYTNIQQDQKAKLVTVKFVCVYGGRGGGGVLEDLRCFVRGGQNFCCLLFVCVSGGVMFSTSPSV